MKNYGKINSYKVQEKNKSLIQIKLRETSYIFLLENKSMKSIVIAMSDYNLLVSCKFLKPNRPVNYFQKGSVNS